MSRARVFHRSTIVTAALAALLTASCIFSPDDAPPTPPTPPRVVDSPEALVLALGDAYQARRYDLLERLFHEDYLFLLQPDPLNPGQPTDWGRTEELRIHRRMFDPQNTPPSEDPVPEELWLTGITIQLNTSSTFQDRTEYYVSATNPDGLDPQQWKATGTDYNTSVLFETQGETDYQVTGQAYFVVVQDLTKTPGDEGSFLLYRWQDLGSGGNAQQATPAM